MDMTFLKQTACGLKFVLAQILISQDQRAEAHTPVVSEFTEYSQAPLRQSDSRLIVVLVASQLRGPRGGNGLQRARAGRTLLNCTLEPDSSFRNMPLKHPEEAHPRPEPQGAIGLVLLPRPLEAIP